MKRLLFLFLPLMLIMSSCKGCDRSEDDSSADSLSGRPPQCEYCLKEETCSRCGKSGFCEGQPPKCKDCRKKTCSRCGKEYEECDIHDDAEQPGRCSNCCYKRKCSLCDKEYDEHNNKYDSRCFTFEQRWGRCSDCYRKCSRCRKDNCMLVEKSGMCQDCYLDCHYKQNCSYCHKEYYEYDKYKQYGSRSMSEGWGRCSNCRYKQKCSRCDKEYEEYRPVTLIIPRKYECPDCRYKCSQCGKDKDKNKEK